MKMTLFGRCSQHEALLERSLRMDLPRRMRMQGMPKTWECSECGRSWNKRNVMRERKPAKEEQHGEG